jgi:hypothetical protein
LKTDGGNSLAQFSLGDDDLVIPGGSISHWDAS